MRETLDALDGKRKLGNRKPVVVDTNENRFMHVMMGFGAFRPTQRTPIFPRTETTAASTSQYLTGPAGTGWPNAPYESYPAAAGYYAPGNVYGTTQGAPNQYYQAGPQQGYAGQYGGGQTGNTYGQAGGQYGQTGTYQSGEAGNAYNPPTQPVATAAKTPAEPAAKSSSSKSPPCSIVVREMPGRDGQRSRTAMRDLIRGATSHTKTSLPDEAIKIPKDRAGQPLNYLYVTFKTPEEASAAKEALDNKWLEIGTKRRQVKVAFVNDSEVPGTKKAPEQDTEAPAAVSKAYEAPLVGRGSNTDPGAWPGKAVPGSSSQGRASGSDATRGGKGGRGGGEGSGRGTGRGSERGSGKEGKRSQGRGRGSK